MRCEHCERTFEKRGRRDIFCSKECFKRSERRKKNWTRYNRKKGYKPRINKTCIICNIKYTGTDNGKFLCKKCCGLKAYRNWRTRKAGKENLFSDEQWAYKLNCAGGICGLCGNYVGKEKLTQDHIIPLNDKRKKKYYIEDIQALCKKCNSGKDNNWRIIK